MTIISRFFLKRAIFIGIAFLLFSQTAYAALDPNDIHYPQQWYLPQIGGPSAWEITAGAPDVVVAVLDTGVDITHEDLRKNIWRNPGEIAGDNIDNDKNGYIDDIWGWDFIEQVPDPRPSAEPPFSRTALHHGTVVAGVIAAEGNNRTGIAGVAWRTRIMPLRVLDKDGQGDARLVTEAIDYAVRNGADIINLSFVGSGYSRPLYNALRRAWEADVVVVVAAGNNGSDLRNQPLYPVCFDEPDEENWIVGVTATDSLDQKLAIANYGSGCVDIAAPGIDFFGTQVFDIRKGLTEAYGGSWKGTSLAAPVVSGVAALIRATEPTLTNAQVIEVLQSSSDDIRFVNRKLFTQMGAGRINASRALTGAAHPGIVPPVETTTAGGRVVSIAKTEAEPLVKVFTGAGELRQSWLGYEDDFKPGGSVAVSETSRQSVPEGDQLGISLVLRGEQRIVLGESVRGKGRIRVTNLTGEVVAQWFAFDRPFAGGVNVAAGNIGGSGYIAAVPASGGGPQVRIFDRGGRVVRQFFAYDKFLRGGFAVAVADVTGDGTDEIIVSSITHDLPVRVFSSQGWFLAEWRPYPQFRGGVNVAAGDLSRNGIAEIVTVPVAGGGPQVRIFNKQGQVLGQFFVLDKTFRGGVNLAVGDINSDDRDEIAITPLANGGPQVRLFDGQSRLIGQFFAYDKRYRDGVELTILR